MPEVLSVRVGLQALAVQLERVWRICEPAGGVEMPEKRVSLIGSLYMVRQRTGPAHSTDWLYSLSLSGLAALLASSRAL